MWAIQCNLDKIIIFTSFLVVLIICGVLVSEGEEGEDYTKWLMDQVRGGWQHQQQQQQEVDNGNSTQLDQAGKRLLQSYLIDTVTIATIVTTSPSQQMNS